jgi:PqqD family protein of HPr-rel-A system
VAPAPGGSPALAPFQSGATTVWRLCSTEPLSWRVWDGDYALFDPATGQTHLLDVLAAETLKALSAPSSPQELVDRLSRAMDIAANRDLVELVDSLIVRFEAMGLIEPSAP